MEHIMNESRGEAARLALNHEDALKLHKETPEFLRNYKNHKRNLDGQVTEIIQAEYVIQ